GHAAAHPRRAGAALLGGPLRGADRRPARLHRRNREEPGVARSAQARRGALRRRYPHDRRNPMTDDLALAEERLRAVLTARAADIPAKDLHDRVVRRARRRRITVVAVSAIAVAAVAAGVPAALAAVRSDPAPPPDPTARPVPAPYPLRAPDDTARGGPRPAGPAGRRGLAGRRSGRRGRHRARRVGPAVPAGERCDGSSAHQGAGGAPRGGRLDRRSGNRRRPHRQAAVRRAGRRPGSGSRDRLVERLVRGHQADAPAVRQRRRVRPDPGLRSAQGAGGRSARSERRSHLEGRDRRRRDGRSADFAPGAGTVRVHRGDQRLATNAFVGPDAPKGPSRAEMARKLLSAPGNLADRKNKVGLVDQTYGVYLPVPQRDAEVLWAGQGTENVEAAAAVTTLPSGAQLLWGGTVTWDRGQSGVEPFNAVVAAGALDRTAYRLPPGQGAALPGRARPQGIFFTGTRRVEITSGGKTR